MHVKKKTEEIHFFLKIIRDSCIYFFLAKTCVFYILLITMDDVFTILYLLFISYLHNYTIFFLRKQKLKIQWMFFIWKRLIFGYIA